MAQIITILGAMLGFSAAVLGYFAFDLTFLSAFAIWAISGPLAAIFGFVMTGAPKVAPRETRHSTFDAAA